MMEIVEATILKGVGGFYYIRWQGREIECKAGGRLRLRRDFRPAVGDLARVELRGEDEGLITEILPRRSFLLRPPIANIGGRPDDRPLSDRPSQRRRPAAGDSACPGPEQGGPAAQRSV